MMRFTIVWRCVLAFALAACLSLPAASQTPPAAPATAAPAPAKLRTFASAEAAADALTEAIRKDDDTAVSAMLGSGWREFVPGTRQDEDETRSKFLAAWDAAHQVVLSGDKAQVHVGTTGYVMPIPIVREDGAWHFDVEAGRREIQARLIGHNELTVVQSLLALVDAQHEYAARDPMKTGVPTYARRLLSTPGRKDGLYWEVAPGEPQSPLGALMAKAQPGDGPSEGYYGYRFRLLYGQGPAAPGGAYSYLANGRMIGGFGAIAWPVRYGETGVMTFIVNFAGDVYEQDLGPDTAARAGEINLFDPGPGWEKSDTTPP
jgi:hypothetical protein